MPVATAQHQQHTSTREQQQNLHQTHLSLNTSFQNNESARSLSPRYNNNSSNTYFNDHANTNSLQDTIPNTMKADRRVDPVPLTSTSSASTITTSSSRRHSQTTNTHEHNNPAPTATKTNSRKRKAANSEPNNRRNSHLSDDAANTTSTDGHIQFITSSSAKQIGRGSTTTATNADGEGYVIAVSGRKKRVLVSPTPSTTTTSAKVANQQQREMDLDMNSNSDVDVVTVDEVVPRKKSRGHVAAAAAATSNPTESLVPATVSKNKSSKRGAAIAASITSTDTKTTSPATTNTAPVTKATALVAEASPVNEEGDKITNIENDSNATDKDHPAPTSSAKKSKRISTTTGKGTTAKSRRSKSAVAAPSSTEAVSPAAPTSSTPLTGAASSAPSTAAPTPGPGSDAAPQKRVLPSRGGGLRDKNTISIEPSLLEPPPVPAGEYILYLADQQTFQRTTLDPKRVPPVSYGGIEAPLPIELTTTALAEDATRPQPSPFSTPPPSATTHIEVPIFKLCSISQFLQEEKKRKMQLLTKALAKAEAEAAAEAKALAQSEAAPSTTPRAVSTRQKHKAIVNNQQVSVQTAVPSFFSSSSTHVKRATTTNTTVGKIEGTMSGGGGAGGSYATQEENLSDEVYEKRHRKQEMVEKKLKNREKEKLRHAMYQQQLVVEKLRHMEVNRLVPISAFRSLQKTIELEQQLKEANASLDDAHQHHSNSISLAAAKMMQDEYHRRLLQEAEENLRRYEQLGLADSANISSAPAYTPFSRTKNRLVTIMTDLDEEEQAPVSEHVAASSDKRDRPSRRSHPNGLAPSETRRKRPKSADSLMGDAQESASPQRRRKKISAASSGDATSISPKAQATPAAPAKLSPTPVVEPPRPPKPITTFIKPGSILASGSRKSYRVTLAFGEKVPSLDRIDFDLPLDLFGDLIRERFGDNEAALQPLKGVAGFKASKKQHQQLASRSVSTETGVPASFSSTGDDTSESQAEVTEPSSAVSSSSSPASSPVSVSSTT